MIAIVVSLIIGFIIGFLIGFYISFMSGGFAEGYKEGVQDASHTAWKGIIDEKKIINIKDLCYSCQNRIKSFY